MSNKNRQRRLREAAVWYPTLNLGEKNHIVKEYKKKFGVDNDCAKRELCELGVLPPSKQAQYEQELKSKQKKKKKSANKRKQNAREKADRKNEFEDLEFGQDDTFYFIAGFTSGGAPYGITWEEFRRMEFEQSLRQLTPPDDSGWNAPDDWDPDEETGFYVLGDDAFDEDEAWDMDEEWDPDEAWDMDEEWDLDDEWDPDEDE